MTARAERHRSLARFSRLFLAPLALLLLSACMPVDEAFIFPIASMPWILQYISTIIPANYFIQIEKAIMLKGAGIDAVWSQSLVLIFMFCVLIGASVKNFKVRY